MNQQWETHWNLIFNVKQSCDFSYQLTNQSSKSHFRPRRCQVILRNILVPSWSSKSPSIRFQSPESNNPFLLSSNPFQRQSEREISFSSEISNKVKQEIRPSFPSADDQKYLHKISCPLPRYVFQYPSKASTGVQPFTASPKENTINLPDSSSGSRYP